MNSSSLPRLFAFLFLVAPVFFAHAQVDWADSLTLPKSEQAIRLFNGHDLFGWHGQKEKHGAVENFVVDAASTNVVHTPIPKENKLKPAQRSLPQAPLVSVNITIPKRNKLALVSNPLDAVAGNNTIANLFKGVPDGTQVYKYAGTTFITATYDGIDNAFGPTDAANTEIKPGEGVFIRNTSDQDLTITFVGEAPRARSDNPYPKGLSIRGSIVPQKGTAEELGFKGVDGDAIAQFQIDTQSYYVSTYDGIDKQWGPPLKRLEIGEAFFLLATTGGTWSQEAIASPRE